MFKAISFSFLCVILSFSCKNKNNQNEQKDTFKFKPRLFWVIVDAAVIRTEPSVSSGSIGIVKEGDGIMVVDETGKQEAISGRKGEWMKVHHNDKDGFIFGGLISEESDMFLEPMRKDDLMPGLCFSCAHDLSSGSNFEFSTNNEIQYEYGTEDHNDKLNGVYQVFGDTVFIRLDKGERTEYNFDPTAEEEKKYIVSEISASSLDAEKIFKIIRSESGDITGMKKIGERPDVYTVIKR